MQQLFCSPSCRLWTAPLAPQTPPRSACRANASRRAATGSWAPRRSLTNAASVEETIRAARRSRACSPSPCKCWVTTCASLPLPALCFLGWVQEGHGDGDGGSVHPEQTLLVLAYIAGWRPGLALKEKQDRYNVLLAPAGEVTSVLQSQRS